MTEMDEIETEKPKRKPGRPKGYPKSGGRAKGTPNRSSVQTRARIQELTDPIAFLAEVMDGKRQVCAGEPGDGKKTWVYPTLTQRVQAGEVLLRKLLPDLKSTELKADVQTYTRVERLIVDPVNETPEPAEAPANSLVGNGEDKNAQAEERDSTERGPEERAARRGRMGWME